MELLDRMADRAIVYGGAVFSALFGFFLVSSALEGADVLPRYFVRPEVEYTAYKAVVMLLCGQASLAASVLVPLWWRKVR